MDVYSCTTKMLPACQLFNETLKQFALLKVKFERSTPNAIIVQIFLLFRSQRPKLYMNTENTFRIKAKAFHIYLFWKIQLKNVCYPGVNRLMFRLLEILFFQKVNSLE